MERPKRGRGGASAAAIAALGLFLLAAVATPAAALQTDQEWTFTGVDRVEIDGVSGDVTVRPADGDDVVVVLRYEVEPAGAFRAEVDASGSTLRIEEHWSGRRSSGRVEWTVRLPAGLQPLIDVDTASGDLDAIDVEARFRLDTASGDARMRDVGLLSGSRIDTASGDLELIDTVVGDDVEMDTASGDVELTGVQAGRGFSFSTASGDVVVERCRGVLEGSSASGNVRVIETELDGPSDFSSASGDVVVRLAGPPAHDLEASSASGDVELEAASFGTDFTLVMSKREDRGRIRSPFEVTSERTFHRHDHLYVEQTVERGSGGPLIRLSTASGSIEVRERS